MSPSAPEYQTWTYDDFDRLRRFQVAPGYRDSIVAYDSLGRVRQLRTVAGERTHSYDAFGRLTLVVGAGDTGHDRFVYDLVGNRLQDTSWTYQVEGGTNQLRYKTHRNEACSFEYRYDLRGNETSVQRVVGTPSCSTMEERRQTYDPENRLVETRRILNTGMATAIEDREYWYDALGRRILMRSTNDTASDNGTWRYFWFGDHVGVKTWNSNDSGLVDLWWPSLQRGSSRGEWFIYGPGVDNLLGSLVFRGKYGHDVRYVFEQDYRGSVRAVQDDSGRAVPGLDGGGFGAFGTPAGSRTEALAGFNGAEHAGGLVYMRNRWYDPNTGRFTQEDPIGAAGGINLYAYAGNDPVSYSDPFGLCPKEAGGDGKTETFEDCPEGTSGFYAHRDAQGHGGVMNNLKGAAASCKESTSCTVVGLLGGVGIAAIGVRGVLASPAVGAIAAAAAPAATQLTIQFGRAANQVSHTFRHTDAAGLNRGAVQAAVQQHLPTVASQLSPGRPLNQIIEVAGQRIQYTAYPLANGVVNVGRIHPIP